MIKSRMLPPFYRAAFLWIGLTAILFNGCAGDAARGQAAYDLKIRRTEQLLIESGDADSLAAAAMLSIGPTGNQARRLVLIERAVSKAPDRPDLLWLNIRLCAQANGCDSETLEAQLRALAPGNAAAWLDSINRGGKRNNVAAVRMGLAAIATSRRFDTYWNTTIVHVTKAIVKTHTMDLPTALVATFGLVSAASIPPYQPIVNACKGDALQDPDMLGTCRQVSTVMRGGDTYLTEMVGIAIAKRTWPEGSPTFVDAISAKRLAHYRMAADGKVSLHHYLSSDYASKRLRLLTEKKTEQEVLLAEILNAKGNPDPPSDWADK
jgi:hypothetical protein